MSKIKLTLVVIGILSLNCEAKDFWGKLGDAFETAGRVATDINNSIAISEISTATDAWKELQEDYIIETGNVGNCKQIGYAPPGASQPSNRGEAAYFSYECTANKGVARWTAKNKVDLGNCEAGNKWSVSISIDDDGEREISSKSPSVKSCQTLIPDFGKY